MECPLRLIAMALVMSDPEASLAHVQEFTSTCQREGCAWWLKVGDPKAKTIVWEGCGIKKPDSFEMIDIVEA